MVSSNVAPTTSLPAQPKKDNKKRGLETEIAEPDTKKPRLNPEEKAADSIASSASTHNEIQEDHHEAEETHEVQEEGHTEETGDPSFIPI